MGIINSPCFSQALRHQTLMPRTHRYCNIWLPSEVSNTNWSYCSLFRNRNLSKSKSARNTDLLNSHYRTNWPSLNKFIHHFNTYLYLCRWKYFTYNSFIKIKIFFQCYTNITSILTALKFLAHSSHIGTKVQKGPFHLRGLLHLWGPFTCRDPFTCGAPLLAGPESLHSKHCIARLLTDSL
jgi:hypothetical protein